MIDSGLTVCVKRSVNFVNAFFVGFNLVNQRCQSIFKFLIYVRQLSFEQVENLLILGAKLSRTLGNCRFDIGWLLTGSSLSRCKRNKERLLRRIVDRLHPVSSCIPIANFERCSAYDDASNVPPANIT